jgi:hypothetical protein
MREGDAEILMHVDHREHTLRLIEMQSFPRGKGFWYQTCHVGYGTAHSLILIGTLSF